MIDHDNLEAFADPVDYDRQDPSDTGVAFYATLARETGGPVLEIACGTGRVAIPIARQGFAVTGLDVVPSMLERARSKSAGLPIRWIEGDARAFDLGDERFRLIFSTGNAFQAFLTNADLSHFRFHDLRHTAANLMLRAGTPVNVVAHVLGHKDPAMTMRCYAHALPDMQGLAATAVDGYSS